MPACSRATCDSRAIVTLSRNRRCIRADTVASSQLATAETASALTAKRSSPGLCSSSPSPSSLNQTASSASGTAATRASVKDTPISAGSYRKPSRHSRHIDRNAGGSLPTASWSGEDIEGHLLFPFLRRPGGEPLGLEREHPPVPAAQCQKLVMAAELHDGAVGDHRDP